MLQITQKCVEKIIALSCKFFSYKYLSSPAQEETAKNYSLRSAILFNMNTSRNPLGPDLIQLSRERLVRR